MDKNLAANAGDTGLIPGPGRSHMQQSNQACELQLLGPAPRARAPRQETPPQWEARAPQLESCPGHCSWREPAQQQRPTQPRRKRVIFKKLHTFKKKELHFCGEKRLFTSHANPGSASVSGNCRLIRPEAGAMAAASNALGGAGLGSAAGKVHHGVCRVLRAAETPGLLGG